MRRLFFIISIILLANRGYGYQAKPVAAKVAEAVIQYDTSTVSQRHFDTVALKAYSKQPEFKYNESKEGLSWLDRFGRWLWNIWNDFKNWLDRLFSSEPTKNAKINSLWSTVIKYLFITLGAGAVVFLILKLLGIDMQNIFRKKSASVAIPYSEFFEDINAISFDKEIENAVSVRNYRFAVRLLYLKCLKQLSDANLIKWEIDKTNSTYISELNNADQRTAFSMLTRKFEYVWYGEFMVDDIIYKDIDTSFQDFNRQMA